MLKEEQHVSNSTEATEPLTYGAYMRVPELLALQTPLGKPPVPDEMLFIIVQQAQELWFKQLLYDLHNVVADLHSADIASANRLLTRSCRILKVLGEEVAVLETMPPQEFKRFRHVLSQSSGFESEQFRELELACGLREPALLRVIDKHMDAEAMRTRWPINLHDAFLERLADMAAEPVDAVVRIYTHVADFPRMYDLAEVLSEYEVLFSEWRFHHIKLVERAIGDRSMGTAGSSGAGYLSRTLQYRFFPELWEARNRITSGSE
ncbi:MAG: tryptophan 2,3-dioxygenase family protein [Chloroflexota bacterium]|nr:tryptophan 2,3-dioxygenase family protein [Chloroflexota bacterium]